MAEERTFVEKIQDCLKGVDGMVPYMFPMIGKNYEKSEKRILVIIDFVRKYACKKDTWSIPENISKDELCTKDDNIRGAWKNMRYKNKKLQKILEERFLEVDCDVDDVILTSFSRWPSVAKKFEHGINEINVLGEKFPDYIKKVPSIFLQALIECSNPDEVWFLGKGTERLVLDIRKYYKREDYDDIRKNYCPNDEHKWKLRKKDLKSLDENILLEEFSQGKFKCVTIEITKPKDSDKKNAKDVSDKLKKKFDKIVQGKEFAKLRKEQQKDCLSSFVNHIKEAIKQLE